jgi:hypothetical protein
MKTLYSDLPLDQKMERCADEWKLAAKNARDKNVEDQAAIFDAREDTYRICAAMVRTDASQVKHS